MKENEMTLAEAALQLGMSWHTAWSRVLTGALAGRKDETGRWCVTKESVSRLKRTAKSRQPEAVA